jgi:hypothetical protein
MIATGFFYSLGLSVCESIVAVLALRLAVSCLARKYDERRSDRELRRQLSSRMTGAVYPLHLLITECLWRAQDGKDEDIDSSECRRGLNENGSHEENENILSRLGEVFEQFRVDAAVIEMDLAMYFECSKKKASWDEEEQQAFIDAGEPWAYWHAVKDLLSIQYYAISPSMSDGRQKGLKNGVWPHTGLGQHDPVQLKTVRTKFESTLFEGFKKVQTAKRMKLKGELCRPRK